MNDAPWDLITIGGGPAGLMCSLTAVSGIPIDPPRNFSCLLLDAGRIGQFARHGKLRLTYKWHFMGEHLIRSLEAEARSAGIELAEHERVVSVALGGEIKTVRTERAEHRTRCVAICTGFFPHGELLEYRDAVRPVFSPAGLEARVITAGAGEQVVILGGGASTARFARELSALRPELRLLTVVEDDACDLSPAVEAGVEVFRGRLRVRREREGGLDLELTALGDKKPGKRFCRLLLIDYNSYTTATAVTDFLRDSGVSRRSGYVLADSLGQTDIAGVVAAGNIVTPVSGALTALSTGFTAGLVVHRYLYEQRFGIETNYFPWLPREGLEAHPLATGPVGPKEWTIKTSKRTDNE